MGGAIHGPGSSACGDVRGLDRCKRLADEHLAGVRAAQFPAPRNTTMQNVHCMDLRTRLWVVRPMSGSPPNCAHWRRNLSAIEDADHGQLIVFGAPPAARHPQPAFCQARRHQTGPPKGKLVIVPVGPRMNPVCHAAP